MIHVPMGQIYKMGGFMHLLQQQQQILSFKIYSINFIFYVKRTQKALTGILW